MLISTSPHLSASVRICPFLEGQKRVKLIGRGGRRGERRRDWGEWEERTGRISSSFLIIYSLVTKSGESEKQWENHLWYNDNVKVCEEAISSASFSIYLLLKFKATPQGDAGQAEARSICR